MSSRLAAKSDSPKLPTDQFNELMKLRGEVGLLRKQAGEVEKSRNEINKASQRASLAEQNLAAALSAKAKFTAHETATVNAMNQLGLAMRIWSNDHGLQYATNFNQLSNELGGSFTIGGIDIYAFEFVNIGLLKPAYPGVIWLRERLARQAPDGTWNRIYGFADGSVKKAASSDGNFDAWEKQNQVSPPVNQ